MGFTAIYDTASIKNVQYSFKAGSLDEAKAFVDWKFMPNDFVIRNDESGEEVEYSNKQKYEC